MKRGKIKNKRFARRHVLNVKMRTSERRKLRLRRTFFTLSIAFLVTFSCYIIWRGGDAFVRWAVLENPYFEIHQLEVETDGVIRKDAIRQWAGVRFGLNLFALDLSRVKRDLELIPSIASCEIERVLPDTIKIRVKEREPVAQFILPKLAHAGLTRQGLYIVDRDGYVMLPLHPDQCREPQDATIGNLPYLVGVPLQELRSGYQLESPQAVSALKLIETFRKSSLAGQVKLEEIDIRIPGALQVQTDQDTRIMFGLEQFDRQILRWQKLHLLSVQYTKKLISIDLSPTNNVPLIWVDRYKPILSDPQSLPSTRLLRKNV